MRKPSFLLVFLLVVLTLSVTACGSAQSTQEQQEPTVVAATEQEPTEIPSASPVPPTATDTPTSTPIPPTPTLEPPPVLSDYLVDPVVRFSPGFEGQEDWEFHAGAIEEGKLVVKGDGAWNGLTRTRTFGEGTGMLVRFTYSSGSEFEVYFDHGQWQQDDYRRFGIYVTDFPKANLWQGANGLGFRNLVGNFQPKIDTWYEMMIGIGNEGDFLALIWDPEDPSQLIRYHEQVGDRWDDLRWRFAIGANEGTAIYENYRELSFDAFK